MSKLKRSTPAVTSIDKRRDEVIRREAGKAGLRGKINAMCVYCIYDPYGGRGNWKQQVSACTSPSCPLFDVRPQSTSK